MSLGKLHQKIFWLLLFLLPVQIGRHFWPGWSFVLGLRVDYLSPTVYLTDILVVLILGLWGIEKFKVQSSPAERDPASREKFKVTIKNSKFLFFYFSIFIFLLVNCFLAQNQGAAFYKLVKVIEFFLLGLYIAKNNYVSRLTSHVLPWTVIYSSLIALAQFLKQASLNGIFYWLGERTFNAGTPGIAKIDWIGRLLMRPYATFPHPNVLAGFILVSLILIFNSQLKSTSDGDQAEPGLLRGGGVREALRWLAIVLGIVAIFLSFSRSAWLVGLLICFWMVRGLKVNVLRVTCYVLLIFLPALLLISVGGGSRFAGKLPIFTGDSLSQRMRLNNVAFQLIKQSPLIGVGLNNFIPQLSEFPQSLTLIYWLQPVHNIYLLITAETGIIGLLIFLWFLVLTFKKLSIINYQLSIALSSILLLGLFDHYWLTLQQTQLLLAIVLGLSWGSVKITS